LGFDIAVPKKEDQLFSLMEGSEYHLLAGGTDLFVKIEKGLIEPGQIIDLTEVLDGPKFRERSDEVEIRATTTHGDLARSSLIGEEFPVLARSAGAVGGTQLRNMATVGGNICNASPSADTLIALYLLDAEVNLMSREGPRSLSIKNFITGPGETRLRRGEYLKSITVPRLAGEFSHFFKKVGRRNALDISVCSMGFLLKETESIIESIRLAYGAVAPVIVRPKSVENYLQGEEISESTISEARELLRGEISPISDIRGSAEYREEVALRSLEELKNVSESP